MKKSIVAVRDAAADAYMAPFVVQKTAMAVRQFKAEVNKKDGNPLASHPEDYDLCLLGEFDEDTGELLPCRPSVIIRGKDCLEGVN